MQDDGTSWESPKTRRETLVVYLFICTTQFLLNPSETKGKENIRMVERSVLDTYRPFSFLLCYGKTDNGCLPGPPKRILFFFFFVPSLSVSYSFLVRLYENMGSFYMEEERWKKENIDFISHVLSVFRRNETTESVDGIFISFFSCSPFLFLFFFFNILYYIFFTPS